MIEVMIDGKLIKSQQDLFGTLSTPFGYEPFYVRSLAGLWDVMAIDIVKPMRLTWIDCAISRKNLGEQHFNGIVLTFEGVIRYDREHHPEKLFEYVLI